MDKLRTFAGRAGQWFVSVAVAIGFELFPCHLSEICI